MSLEQDQPLINRTLNGDMGAFADLVDRYKYMVYTLAMRMVKNKEEAEEIAQDSFLKAYQGLKRFKGDAKFSTWLYKIAYYRSLDYVRKSGRKIETTSIDKVYERHLGEEENVIMHFERSEQNKTIKDALRLLPGDDGILITLFYYEELSLQEISAVMDLTANNVKVKLFRARKRLMNLLADTLEPEIIRSYAKDR
ncbi:RNA polymerase sigma factor [Maribacter arenosus]|uniref:RNA polymerase sigma factor n=1 Tax=Maribacter arenosus TaxID=1854708 RepID=A0ABR7VJ18_9FLAO|nr:sigma-70 family RNA polymerase sigma factor [Maribacter arenosus]MBD0852152.1 sigma-70 family RNA polymerase sigma factor [Maribacter arenosus]